MNEIIIVVHPGDRFDDLVKTAMEIVKIETVSYALITFNDCKVFVKKDSTEESAKEEYMQKLTANQY
jgi:hypothetical protein